MTTEQLNMGLIDEMRGKIPDGTNLAKILMDILYIGKEAVYRRLRSEVPFTMAEVALISRKFGISVDRLLGMAGQSNAIFDINMVKPTEPVESYCQMLKMYSDEICCISSDRESEMAISSNMIPEIFKLQCEGLSKFRFYKWMYQYNQMNFSRKFEDMMSPESVLQIHKEYVRTDQKVASTTFVWDSMLFWSLVNDIRYFAGLGLISRESVIGMKEELRSIVDQMEQVATIGKWPTGNNVNMYISSINLEATYGFVRGANSSLSQIRVYSINSLTSKSAEVCNSIREWIQSLTKFSILISQSGEMHRIEFFNKQREIIDAL